MPMTYGRIVHFSFFCFSCIAVGCHAPGAVDFATVVDTTDKPIDRQVKKSYALSGVGVYASNDFDGARLGDFKKKNDSTALVLIYPENSPVNNSAYYAFKTWSDTAKFFYFRLQYPEGHSHRYVPKLKTDDGWRVVEDSCITLTKEGTPIIKLKLDRDTLLVAAQEIQSSTDVASWYSELAKGKENYVAIKHVGKSVLGRDIPVLDISKGENRGKDIIVLLTRQHPPEVTGYYAFQSFLSTILDNSDLSRRFVSKYRILAFPILNPDGVDLGHWRHNANGVDLNRDWAVYNQPEIRQVVQLIDTALRKNKSKLVLGLDFHSTWHDVFYTNKKRSGTALPHFIGDWLAALEENIPGYTVNEQSSNSTKPVSKGWFLYGHNAVGITYEIGDKTPRDSIELIGRVSAKQMTRILLSE